jgi:hypothetical protein
MGVVCRINGASVSSAICIWIKLEDKEEDEEEKHKINLMQHIFHFRRILIFTIKSFI